MRPVPAGKSVRMSFSRQKEVLEMPNLIEIQKDSYQWFLDEGLKEVFDDISPIADFAGYENTPHHRTRTSIIQKRLGYLLLYAATCLRRGQR